MKNKSFLNIYIYLFIQFNIVFTCTTCWAVDNKFVEALENEDIYNLLSFIQNTDVSIDLLVADENADSTAETFANLILRKLEQERKIVSKNNFDNETYALLLQNWYVFLKNTNTYTSILLRDVLKRCYLEYTAVNLKRSNEFLTDNTLQNMSLLPVDLYSLTKENPEFVKHTNSTLQTASEAVWVSYGMTNMIDGYIGLDQVLPLQIHYGYMTSSNLLKKHNNVRLAIRILTTEQLRVCSYEVTKQYLIKGGKLDNLTLSDVSGFYKVLSFDESSKICFMPLAKRRSGVDDILMFTNTLQKNTEPPVWIKQAFE